MLKDNALQDTLKTTSNPRKYKTPVPPSEESSIITCTWYKEHREIYSLIFAI